MLERKPASIAWLALIPLVVFACLLCGLFGLLAGLADSLSDPYAAIRTSLAENNLLTPITAGPTTTPGTAVTYSSNAPAGILSTAGKLSDQTASVTPTVNGPASQSGTPTVTQVLIGTPSPSATPVRVGTASPTTTQASTEDQSISATITAIGNCDCQNYDEDDPRNLNCTTTSFNSIQDAQACFNFCMSTTGNDVYGLDGNNDGTACEEGLNTPTPTQTP